MTGRTPICPLAQHPKARGRATHLPGLRYCKISPWPATRIGFRRRQMGSVWVVAACSLLILVAYLTPLWLHCRSVTRISTNNNSSQQIMTTTEPQLRIEVPDIWMAIRLPGRLNRRETAALLGFTEAAVSHLVHMKFLEPLGEPAFGDPLWFATTDILDKCNNRKWLSKATKAVREFNFENNNSSVDKDHSWNQSPNSSRSSRPKAKLPAKIGRVRRLLTASGFKSPLPNMVNNLKPALRTIFSHIRVKFGLHSEWLFASLRPLALACDSHAIFVSPVVPQPPVFTGTCSRNTQAAHLGMATMGMKACSFSPICRSPVRASRYKGFDSESDKLLFLRFALYRDCRSPTTRRHRPFDIAVKHICETNTVDTRRSAKSCE